tara:strand:+ start:1558 stop:2787 length:1230 start_codon:yes stop_codon:yes gene_type:complete
MRLDYSLSSGMLDRLKEAGRTRERSSIGDAIIGLGDEALGVAEHGMGIKKEELEQERKAQELQDERDHKEKLYQMRWGDDYGIDPKDIGSPTDTPEDISTPRANEIAGSPYTKISNEPDQQITPPPPPVSMSDSFEKMGSRGSALGSNVFGQMGELLKQLKETKFMPGDQEQRAKTSKELGEVSASVQSWKSSIEEAKEIHDGVGWSEGMSKEDEKVVSAVVSQEGVGIGITGDNELGFSITTEDGRVLDVSRSAFDRITSQMKPVALEKEWNDSLMSFEKMGGDPSRSWNQDSMLKQNMNNITPDNLLSIMFDKWTGSRSIAEQYYEGDKLGPMDFDIKQLIAQAKDNPELFEELQEDIAFYLTSKQKKMYDLGKRKYDQENIAIKSLGSNKTEGMSAAQKIQFYKNL